MDRRKFVVGLSSVGVGMPVWAATTEKTDASTAASATSASAPSGKSSTSSAPTHVTADVADFVVRTTWDGLPPDLIELGKKSILDSLGLALAGRRADTGSIVLRYLKELGLGRNAPGVKAASVLGTALRVAPRFGAIAHSVQH